MAAAPSAEPRTLWGRVVDLFSSITLGIVLLTLLFVYSSIGSSGVPVSWKILEPTTWVSVRQMPMFEMTEFEWFHWWPFDVLIALIAINLVTATLRRIPFRPVNYGVWMIHTGLIVMGVGCVLYFSTKVEGDALVVRRDVHVTLPNGASGSMPAVPGNVLELVGDEGPVSFFVQSVNPRWPILSGDHEGEEAYSVTVSVQEPARMFQRQVLAGYPQYTEDIIRSGNPAQPFTRAVKVTGERLIDDELEVTLDYAPTTEFYVAHNLTKAWALYLREKGSTEWVEREVDGLPMFNDYLASYDDVHLAPGAPRPELRPLNVVASATHDDDPLAGVDIGISQYLRYAKMTSRWVGAGSSLFPVAQLRMHNRDGQELTHELVAFEPGAATSEDGLVQFRWAETEDDVAAMGDRTTPALLVELPGLGRVDEVDVTEFSRAAPGAEWIEVEGTDYAFRVATVENDLRVAPEIPAVSVAILELRDGDGRRWERWAFEHTYPNRDLDPNGAPIALDTDIVFRYLPAERSSPVTLVAGPEQDRLRLVVSLPELEPQTHDVAIGESIELIEENGLAVTVVAYLPNAVRSRRPAIVPRSERNRDAGLSYAMVRADVFLDGTTESEWIPYHQYPIESPNDGMRRFWLDPVTVKTPDGRQVEMILSRQRLDLPAPVVLDDFEVKSHVGGFSGQVSSIADWISRVRFETGDGYTEPLPVSMNKPAQHAGLFYFQAQWDPPQPSRGAGDPPSQGLNYTVLGVGNGRGRYTMLWGVVISVLGMIYAFYVKPNIKRRLVAEARERAAAAAGATR